MSFEKALPVKPTCSTKGMIQPWKLDLSSVRDGDVTTIKGWYTALGSWLLRNEGKSYAPYRFEKIRFCWRQANSNTLSGDVLPVIIQSFEDFNEMTINNFSKKILLI